MVLSRSYAAAIARPGLSLRLGAIAERLDAALSLARADSLRTAEVLPLAPRAGAKGAQAADLRKPRVASACSDRRPADQRAAVLVRADSRGLRPLPTELEGGFTGR